MAFLIEFIDTNKVVQISFENEVKIVTTPLPSPPHMGRVGGEKRERLVGASVDDDNKGLLKIIHCYNQ